jgi:acyl-coenzyme A synthetase/AMP-(fatty) acid ligase/thioesterase domain-containing protein/acyl carrier protein
MESPSDTTVDARFRRIAARFADRPALRHRSTITYRELDRRSDEFAAQLNQSPAVVGVSLAQPVEAIAAMLGVLKARRTYTLIDPDGPLQRKLAIAEEMALELVICDSSSGPWRGFFGRWLDPTTCSAATAVADLGAPALGSSACCIVQTSGTTGQPLGIEISHAALLHAIDSYTAFAQITPVDRLTVLTSPAHFAAHSAIFGALLNGACLCVFDVRTDGFPAMADWMQQERLTIYQSPPSLFRAFCRQLTADRHFATLRFLRLGGEPALMSDYQLFRRYFPAEAQFVNALGISEAAGNVAYFRMQQTLSLPGQLLPVGLPSTGREVFLADSCGGAAESGETGEIVVRSDFLATGYYRRPHLTSQKFRPSPVDGRRELWTGDLGHFTPEGWLIHDGRRDDQVKIRGHRVDIAGLESALCSLAEVHDARVLRRQRDDEADDLIAFVVPVDSGISSDVIRRQLSHVVSSPVLPRVVILEHLPLSPNGKISRAQLLDLAARPIDQRPSAGPRDQMERDVADIWKSVLNQGDIGIFDDFFACGGDSLQALRLMAALEVRYAIRLSPKLFFDFPTIAQMTEYLRTANPDRPDTPLVVVQPEGDGVPFFFMHGDWWGGLYCVRLSSHIGGAHPFCAVPPYRSLAPRIMSLQEMATEHLAVIRRQTPQGPYFLGGYCIGGMLAAEIARQLVEQGEKIVGLFLIDPARSAVPWLRFVWPLIDHAGNVLKWNFRKKLDSMELCGMGVVRWYRESPLGKLASAWRRSGPQKFEDSIMAVSEMDESDAELVKSTDYAVYVHAYRTYRLRRLLVPTTVYIPEEGSPPPRPWTRHIRKMFPMVSFQSIPGDHRTCITKHSEVLGAQLKKALGALSQQMP